MNSNGDVRRAPLAWRTRYGMEQLELWHRPAGWQAEGRGHEGAVEGEDSGMVRSTNPLQLSLSGIEVVS